MPLARRSRRFLAALLLPLAAACADETPTEAGGPLLPGDIRTFEVIVESGRFLLSDTAFSGYGAASDVSYLIAANDFAGALDAHALARFQMPAVVSLPDSAGTVRADSAPTYLSGEVVFLIDSLRSSTRGPVRLELYRTTEAWDAESATWTLRVDSGGVRLPWTTPGGTTGARLDTATWSAAAGDTVRFRVDSLTLAAWRDTADHTRGVLLRVADTGVRLRSGEVFLRAQAQPSIRSDTTVTVTVRPPGITFVYDPPIAAAASSPRLGGITAWRTFLLLKQRLDTLRLPCPDRPGCTVPLRDATINHAALLLEPVAPPAGFVPEDSLRLVALTLLESPQVPLVRSVLGGVAGQMLTPAAPARFAGGGDPIELPLTEYLRAAMADTTSATLSQRIALIPAVQSGTFGFAAFRSLPRLRLIVSIASELQLR